MIVPASAAAQDNDAAILNILRECAKIDEPTARLACFDNNVRADGQSRRAGQNAAVLPQSGARPDSPSSSAQGFGADSIRTPQRFAEPEERAIRASVAAVRERQPGIYLVTLEDGAQWLFDQSAGSFYRAPRKGSTVEIQRGALGGFLLRFDNQTPVGVRRVQ